MPELGLGLSLDKNAYIKSLPKYLTAAGCTMALNVDRQVKALANANSPLANPLVDITKKGNNATLTNFAGTANDGFTQQAVKAESGDLVGYGNTTPNGNFVNGIGWIAGSQATVSVANNTLSIIGNGVGISPSCYCTTSYTAGKRYYSRGKYKVTNAVCLSIRMYDGVVTNVLSNPVANQEYLLSTIKIAGVANPSNYHYYADAATANGKVMEVREFMTVNLDDNPAVIALEAKLGRQLTVLECDRLFAFTATTGQVYVKTPFFAKLDGVDSYMMMANTADVDILGLDDFAISTVFMTPSSFGASNQWYFQKNLSTGTDQQYGMWINVTLQNIVFCLNGVSVISTANTTIIPNTLYRVTIYRKSGFVYIVLNEVSNSVANSTNILTKPNLRIGARSNSVDGTSHSLYFNGFLGNLAIFYNGATGLDITKVEKAIAKFNANYI